MMTSRPVRVLSLAIIAFVVVVGARGVVEGLGAGSRAGLAPSAQQDEASRTVAIVERVLDGDTVVVRLDDAASAGGTDGSAGHADGGLVRVRVLGISAPEIPHPGKPGECYGHASTRHLEQLLPAGTHVTLMSDPTQDDVDIYGRWLRYLEVDGRDIGLAQIRAGAAAARNSSDPVARHADYERVEQQARGLDEGMWSACP